MIVANIIWGATPPIMKWALGDISVFTLAFLRYAIPVVLLFLFFRSKLAVKVKDLPIIAVSAFFGITLNIGLYFIGLKYTESINVTIIASSSPIFLILCAMLFLGEHPSKKMLLGNLMGLTGIFLVVIQPLFNHTPSTSFWGNLLILGATFASLINTLISKKIMKSYNAYAVTFWTFLVGAITFIPSFLEDQAKYGIFWQHLDPAGVIGILFGSLVSSLLAWFIFYWGLKYIPASETGVYQYIDPVATLLIAVPLLHEYPTPFFVLGSCLVFLGIYVAEGRVHWHPFHKLLK